MEIFIYVIIFITGSFFGSFFTLAVYRIPKKEDILIKHSYCPNCNHKLGFFDLFPILSYIFLKGKCKYCGIKIRARYLILELLSGFTFLLLAYGLKINILDINSLISLGFLLIYVSVLIIISGIDKENIKIEKSLLIFGFGIEILYMIYQYTLFNFNVYQYVIYLAIFTLVIILINKLFKNEQSKEYLIKCVILALYIIFYSGFVTFILSTILAIVLILLHRILTKKENKKAPAAFYLSISNILIIVLSNIIINYILWKE